MCILDTVRLNHRIYSTLRCATTCLFFLLIPCIIWSIKSAIPYRRIQNIINNHLNTTCLVLNYTLLKHESISCGTQLTYRTDICFDEHILVKYRIENQSDITSIVETLNTHTLHNQSQVGQSYDCFYHRTSVTTVRLELPNGLSLLIELFLAFGLIISLVLVILIALFYLLVKDRSRYHLLSFPNRDNHINYHYSNIQQTEHGQMRMRV